MGKLIVLADPTERTLALINAFAAAPDDADITLRLGEVDSGPAFVIGVGASLHGFAADEAEPLQLAIERVGNEMAQLGVPVDFSNLILAIREGKRRAVSELPAPSQQENG